MVGSAATGRDAVRRGTCRDAGSGSVGSGSDQEAAAGFAAAGVEDAGVGVVLELDELEGLEGDDSGVEAVDGAGLRVEDFAPARASLR